MDIFDQLVTFEAGSGLWQGPEPQTAGLASAGRAETVAWSSSVEDLGQELAFGLLDSVLYFL